VMHRTDDGGGQTIAARAVLGQNAYVLCGSTHHDPQLMKAFDCDSYIRIENPMAFGQAVARRISGFSGGAEGLCLYQNVRGIERDLGFDDVMRTAPDGTATYDRELLLGTIAGAADHVPLFLKQKSFAHQAEYRLLWFTDGVVPPYLSIKVPDARQFCSPANERTE